MKTKPYEFQLEDYHLSRDLPYWGLFYEMGLGKTKVTLDTACYLHKERGLKGLVVVGDKGNYLNWLNEIAIHSWPDVRWRTWYYDAAKPKTISKLWNDIVKPFNGINLLLVNVEALRTTPACDVTWRFLWAARPAMMVVDESTSIKNPKAKQTKNVIKLGTRADWRRVLTGTPIEHSALDLWSQAEFLKAGLLGRTYYGFKARYAVTRKIKVGGGREVDKVIGFRNVADLHERILAWSSRRTKEQQLDLPPKIWSHRFCEWEKEQLKAYDKLRTEAYVELRRMAGDGDVTDHVFAENVAKRISKLLEICSGFLRGDDGQVSRFPTGKPGAVLRVLEEVGPQRKAIVWCHFREAVAIMRDALEDGGVDHVCYTADMDNQQRQEAILRFRQTDTCRVFLTSFGVAAKGLTLIESDLSIYYAANWNLGHWLQSQDRNHRIGQTRPVNYVTLSLPNSVEEQVRKNLEAKMSCADAVLGANKKQVIDQLFL